jgi:hypothetical protein
MPKAQYTPRPWTTQGVKHQAWIANVGNGEDAPQIWTERQFKPGEQFEWGDRNADARLIAAAPELLEALEACEAYYAKNGGPRLQWDNAKAAIAKAKGE